MAGNHVDIFFTFQINHTSVCVCVFVCVTYTLTDVYLAVQILIL